MQLAINVPKIYQPIYFYQSTFPRGSKQIIKLMKSHFLTTLIQYKFLLVLSGLDNELFTRPFQFLGPLTIEEYSKIRGCS